MSEELFADPEVSYYREVEELFVSRRGDPLFLSNPDWLLVHQWKHSGFPLRVVLRGIADALEGHSRSWSRKRKVGSLAYCQPEVEAAAERWRRALDSGEPDAPGEVSRLDEMLQALRAAESPGPASREAWSTAREQLEQARATQGGGLKELEQILSQAEAALVSALRQDLPEVTARAESEVDAELSSYRERMPQNVLAQIRADAVARRLLSAAGLPRLTLFQ